MIAPPKNLLGRFTEPGKPAEISQWILEQDLFRVDALIVSLDMLAYGGLVASRKSGPVADEIKKRLEVLREIRKKSPTLKIYGFGVRMRLTPTADGKDEVWREKIGRRASLFNDPKGKEELARLEKEIPPAFWSDYQNTRARNLSLNLRAIDLVQEKVLDYLVLSQDDAAPKGLHQAEKNTLARRIQVRNLSEKVTLQNGADEVAMLLLARSFADRYQLRPKIKTVFSSGKVAAQPMPFEDKPLQETVKSLIQSAGAVEVADDKQADLVLYVFGSRLEKNRAVTFSNEISKYHTLNPAKGIVIADIDPVGDVQGADPEFSEQLLTKKLFPDCAGYASWNTAANALGTALAQGLVFSISRSKTDRTLQAKEEMKEAQAWFIRHRLLDDYLFHTTLRPALQEEVKENGWNPLRLTEKETAGLEEKGRERLEEAAKYLSDKFPPGRKSKVSNLVFHLPWNRLFEAEIDFQMGN